MADNIAITAGSGTTVSTEEVTTLNGAGVSAQHVQRVLPATRTADGTAIDEAAGSGTISTSTKRVTLATDDTLVTNSTSIKTAIEIVDDWDESDRCKVNPIAGQAGVAGGSGTVSALTQRVVLATDVALPAGTNLIGYVGHGKTIKSVTGTVSADTDIVAAVASKRIKVIGISLISASTTSNTITMQSNASTALYTVPLQAPSGTVAGISHSIAAPSFLFATAAGEKLTLDVSTAQSVTYNVSYFDDDAT